MSKTATMNPCHAITPGHANEPVARASSAMHMTRLSMALLKAGLVGSTLLAGLSAHAGPQGGSVVAGTAVITQAGPTRTDIVQSSNRAVIDWRDFSIASGEQVNFQVPTTSSATLNRVTGAQASAINGQVYSNGQILLVNPNGILFGPSARVDVGSLIATTARVGTSDFMAGSNKFTDTGAPAASVINQGRITASEGGLVALLAPSVANSGVISARLGTVMLASGKAFTIDMYGDGLVHLAIDQATAERAVDANGRTLASLVSNDGTVIADGGHILLTASAARDVVDQAISLGGMLLARTVENRGGEIILSGSRIAVGPAGLVDVSAAEATQNAGRAVLVATDRMQFEGRAYAYAPGSGDGGFIEISGKRELDFRGRLNASSPRGRAGTLLLDQANVTVDPTLAQTLSDQLSGGTNVVVQADFDVAINSTIDGRLSAGGVASTAFTVNAGHNIDVNAPVLTNKGAIALNAPAGAITMATGSYLYADSAEIALTSQGKISTQDLYTSGAIKITANDAVTLNAALTNYGNGIGSLTLTSNSPQTGVTPTTLSTIYSKDAVTISGDQAVVISGGILTEGGAVTIGAGASGSKPSTVTVNAPINTLGKVAPTASKTGGAIAINASNRLSVANDVGMITKGPATLKAGAGGIAMDATASLDSGAQTIDASGAVTTGVLASTGGIAIESTSSTVTLQGGVLATNAVKVTGRDNVTIGTGGIESGQLEVTAGTSIIPRDVVLRGPIVTHLNGTVTMTASQDIVFQTNRASVVSAGNLTLDAMRNIDLTTAGTTTDAPLGGTFSTPSYYYQLNSSGNRTQIENFDGTGFLLGLADSNTIGNYTPWPNAVSLGKNTSSVNGLTTTTYTNTSGVPVARTTYASGTSNMSFSTPVPGNPQNWVVIGELTWQIQHPTLPQQVQIDCIACVTLIKSADVLTGTSTLNTPRVTLIDSRNSSNLHILPSQSSTNWTDQWYRASTSSSATIFGKNISSTGQYNTYHLPFKDGNVALATSPQQSIYYVNALFVDPWYGTPIGSPFNDNPNNYNYQQSSNANGPVFGSISVGGIPIPQGLDMVINRTGQAAGSTVAVTTGGGPPRAPTTAVVPPPVSGEPLIVQALTPVMSITPLTTTTITSTNGGVTPPTGPGPTIVPTGTNGRVTPPVEPGHTVVPPPTVIVENVTPNGPPTTTPTFLVDGVGRQAESAIASTETRTERGTEIASGSDQNAALETLAFYSGRGVAKNADLGQESSAQGQPANAFCGVQHVAGVSTGDAADDITSAYFRTDPFGRSTEAKCTR